MADAAVADAPVITTTAGTIATPAAGAAAAPPAAAPAPAAKAPDKYDLKLPKDSALGSDWTERTAAHARERGLSQDQAQALVDREAAAASHFAEQQKASLSAVVEGWAEEAKNDKEIGGAAFQENAELARRVLGKYGSEALAKALNDTGLGNHPELLRMFVRVGRRMSEDRTILGLANTPGTAKSREEIFFPTMKKE